MNDFEKGDINEVLAISMWGGKRSSNAFKSDEFILKKDKDKNWFADRDEDERNRFGGRVLSARLTDALKSSTRSWIEARWRRAVLNLYTGAALCGPLVTCSPSWTDQLLPPSLPPPPRRSLRQ